MTYIKLINIDKVNRYTGKSDYMHMVFLCVLLNGINIINIYIYVYIYRV